MKLIIDILDIIYNDIIKEDYSMDAHDKLDIIESIKNGIPLENKVNDIKLEMDEISEDITELENIKTEIEEELCHPIRDEYSQRQNDYCDGLEFAGKRCLEIIDKHLKENNKNESSMDSDI